MLGTVDHKLIFAPLLAVSTGLALYTSYRLIKLNNEQEKDNVYESQKLLNEYLVFHYGSPIEVLKWDFGPKDALDFPKRCADLCLKHYTPKVCIILNLQWKSSLLISRALVSSNQC